MRQLQSCLLASIFLCKKTGLQIRDGRTNIIKTKLKSQIGEVREREYLVNLNDFKSLGSDELHPKPAERNCRCNLRDTISNLQETVETRRSARRQKKDSSCPDF